MPTIAIHKKLQEISKQQGYPCSIPIDVLVDETGYPYPTLKEHIDVLRTLKFIKVFNNNIALTEAGWEANI